MIRASIAPIPLWRERAAIHAEKEQPPMQTHAQRWYRFVVAIKHDRGTVRLRITSPTEE